MVSFMSRSFALPWFLIILLIPAASVGCRGSGRENSAGVDGKAGAAAQVGSSIDEPFKYARVRLGTTVRIHIHGVSRIRAEHAANEAFRRIEILDQVLSDYRLDSEVIQLRTRAPGEVIGISADLLAVLDRSREISARSGGAFDVTSGPLTLLWRTAFASGSLPTEEEVAAAASKVGWSFMHVDSDRSTVQFDLSGMSLDFGGIGKGWIADRALEVLVGHGCPAALVDIGGDLAIGDPPPGREGWRVGVSLDAADSTRSLMLSNCGVATSGDAEQHLVVDSVRYSHLLDPRTGWPLQLVRAVSVMSIDAATADALASAVCVLGPVAGRSLVDRWPDSMILASRLD